MSSPTNGGNFGVSPSEWNRSLEGDFFASGTVGLTTKQVVAIRQLVQAYMLANKIVDDAVETITEQQSVNYWLKLTGDTANMYRLACSIAKNALGARPWSEGKHEQAIDLLVNALSSQYLEDSDDKVLNVKNQYIKMVEQGDFGLNETKSKNLLEAADKLLFSGLNS